MLITIAIPAVKARYLDACLRSALAQTYTDLDILVVDDCSAEPIGAIVSKFSDPRIRYFRNADNIGQAGPAKNWNRCLALARGEWFCLLGDDDIYQPDFVERTVAAGALSPEVDLVRTGVRIIDGDGLVVREVVPRDSHEDWLTFLWERVCNGRLLFATENLIRTAALRRIGGYVDFPAAWCSDDATLLELARTGGVANVLASLACWRTSYANLSTTASASEKLAAIEAYRVWLQSRLSRWVADDPKAVIRREWRDITARLPKRWSDLRAGAMPKSWLELFRLMRRRTWKHERYPRPTIREFALAAAKGLKSSVAQGRQRIRHTDEVSNGRVLSGGTGK